MDRYMMDVQLGTATNLTDPLLEMLKVASVAVACLEQHGIVERDVEDTNAEGPELG